jgi:hypothetical protein
LLLVESAMPQLVGVLFTLVSAFDING